MDYLAERLAPENQRRSWDVVSFHCDVGVVLLERVVVCASRVGG